MLSHPLGYLPSNARNNEPNLFHASAQYSGIEQKRNDAHVGYATIIRPRML